MTAVLTSRRAAPVLLALGVVLLAWIWWFRPEAAVAWGATTLVFGGMAVALGLAVGRSHRGPRERHAADAIARAVVFGASIMVVSLGAKLAAMLGVLAGGELPLRATMVMTGLFFVVTGNAMPKILTPLAALQCDAARVQAFQRRVGWTWVLMGLAFVAVWVSAPVDVAKPASALLLLAVSLILLAHCVRVRRLPRKEMPV